jgi:hypothetical protein
MDPTSNSANRMDEDYTERDTSGEDALVVPRTTILMI